MKRGTLYRWGAAAAAAILLLSIFYSVGESQVAIITQFGRPVAVVRKPGLHARWPWQSRMVLDARLRSFSPAAAELLTSDKKNLVVDAVVLWRLDDPQRFVQAVVDAAGAESRLQDIVRSELSIALGNNDLGSLVSTDPARVRVAAIMEEVTRRCAAAARDQYGIQVVDVRLRRVNLPEENRESVFARMRAERERIARRYRAEGQQEATRIRAEADREKSHILARAYESAEKTRGEGDARSMAIYAAAYNRDPRFYRLSRTLDAYRKFLNDRTTVVLSADSELMRLLTTGRLESGK